jgi:hypothetical protein
MMPWNACRTGPTEGVDRLIRLINDLSVLVVVFSEYINLRNHARHVDVSGGLRGIWCSEDTSRVSCGHSTSFIQPSIDTNRIGVVVCAVRYVCI